MRTEEATPSEQSPLKARLDQLVREGLLTPPEAPGRLPRLEEKGLPSRGELASEQVSRERRDI